ncbi:MAG: T9SS type A sorting domain-containing protein, partial [Ignavibacteria bacterium]|nr:T9SS type A sorting domain-containing protein [Ignavibacteria bacterium]
YTINQKSFVQIKVYNIAGELITTLVNEEKEVGAHEISFEAQNLPSGIYFVKMSADNFNKTIKIILSK